MAKCWQKLDILGATQAVLAGLVSNADWRGWEDKGDSSPREGQTFIRNLDGDIYAWRDNDTSQGN